VQPLHQAGAPVFLLAAGEIDASHAGPELIAVRNDGVILRLDASEQGWSVQPFPLSLESSLFMNFRPTINIGDAHPGFPGNEIVVEMDDAVHVFVQASPPPQQVWQDHIALPSDFPSCWGVRIGDIDPALPGEELFYILEGAFDVSGGYFSRLVDGEWTASAVFNGEVGMDSAIGDSNPASPGNEIVVGTEMGPVYEITPQLDEPPGKIDEWPRRTLWNDFDNAPWTLRIADVLPDEPGHEIVYGTRYSDRILLSRENAAGTGHDMQILYTGLASGLPDMNMWDIAVGDFVPEAGGSPTLEIVGVDQLGMAYLVERDAKTEQWSGQSMWQDPGATSDGGLFASVMADFLPNAPGPEVVVAGQSGQITLITRRETVTGDVTCDGAVDVDDLVAVILSWGPCPTPPPPPPLVPCPTDIDQSGAVDVDDLIVVILNWT
jgi:hypothetical protein